MKKFILIILLNNFFNFSFAKESVTLSNSVESLYFLFKPIKLNINTPLTKIEIEEFVRDNAKRGAFFALGINSGLVNKENNRLVLYSNREGISEKALRLELITNDVNSVKVKLRYYFNHSRKQYKSTQKRVYSSPKSFSEDFILRTKRILLGILQ